MTAAPRQIEAESFRILRGRVDLGAYPARARAVVERVIHATADIDFGRSMRVTEAAVDAGVAALRRGAPVVVDCEMLRAGITGREALCYLQAVPDPSADPGSTRSALAMGLAAAEHAEGAVFAVGNAPTALGALVEMAERGRVRPALVIGLPVGFVGAAEAKAALLQSPLASRSITNVGEKGGSAAAAGAVNALVRLADGAP